MKCAVIAYHAIQLAGTCGIVKRSCTRETQLSNDSTRLPPNIYNFPFSRFCSKQQRKHAYINRMHTDRHIHTQRYNKAFQRKFETSTKRQRG